MSDDERQKLTEDILNLLGNLSGTVHALNGEAFGVNKAGLLNVLEWYRKTAIQLHEAKDWPQFRIYLRLRVNEIIQQLKPNPQDN